MAVSIVATATLLASATGGAQAAPTGPAEAALYLVQTTSEPLAINAATKPSAGEKVNARSQPAREWLAKLRGEHDATLRAARVNTGKKVYDYTVVFNGFAAKLTAAEAARMRNTPGVVQIWKNEIHHADTTTTQDFLGMTGKSGVWQKQFKGDARAGEGVIVGVIDSGVTPQSLSFAALSEPRPDQAVINSKWNGACDTGPEQPVTCNNKLIGARYFKASWDESGRPIAEVEYESARDYHGHGTHTASTAAGTHGVAASINGFAVGEISGMAPAARVAAYKALWYNPATGSASGFTADLAAAVDTAAGDGVDVINYSISGSRDSIISAVDIAFFNAVASGIFVAASAGNTGAAGMGNHNAPWLTTVAASTHDRGNQKTVTLGNGARYTGVGVVPSTVAAAPLVDAETIPAEGRTAAEARLCKLGSLDPIAATGKIVICMRGEIARVEKSKAVQQAGGVGMIQVNNTQAESINGDWHYVPSVHFGPADGNAIKAYAASAAGSATAAMSETDASKVRAPQMAGFSAYGPAVAGGGNLLKPDITAPGVDVIAAMAPTAVNDGKNFDGASGTSMSAPHIAGIAALLKSKNPAWSPVWIKSAMMTTASTKDNQGKPIQWAFGDATPLNYGSGHVVPGSAFDPGLVYDSGPIDWARYGCGLGQFQQLEPAGLCDSVGSMEPSDLNYPSISVAALAGKRTITRTVRNITNKPGVYRPTVNAPAGFSVKVTPSVLVVLPGQSASFKVEITRTNAAFGQWAFGSLTWSELGTGKHKVTSPIAVRGLAVAAATEVGLSGTSGESTQSIQAGFGGALTAKVGGLVASDRSEHSFTKSSGTFNPNDPETAKKVTVTVPEGTALVRFATFDADVPAGTDVDLYVFRNGTQVGSSGGGTSAETVTLVDPAPGTYEVYVHMWGFTAAAPVTVPHHAFVVPATAAGNLTVDPASQNVTTGATATVKFSWSGLTAGSRYLGVVFYGDGSTTLGRTTVSITG